MTRASRAQRCATDPVQRTYVLSVHGDEQQTFRLAADGYVFEESSDLNQLAELAVEAVKPVPGVVILTAQPVVVAAADQRVVAVAAPHAVVSVVAGAWQIEHAVGAEHRLATDERVRAPETIDEVRVTPADEDVVQAAAGEPIGEGAAREVIHAPLNDERRAGVVDHLAA